MSGVKSRRKGHNFELETITKLKEFFPNCVSSRSESKRLDDSGVDIAFTNGFNVQCKNTATAPNFHTLLKSMPKTGMNLVFHKRTFKGVTVTMSEEDFLILLRGFLND